MKVPVCCHRGTAPTFWYAILAGSHSCCSSTQGSWSGRRMGYSISLQHSSGWWRGASPTARELVTSGTYLATCPAAPSCVGPVASPSAHEQGRRESAGHRHDDVSGGHARSWLCPVPPRFTQVRCSHVPARQLDVRSHLNVFAGHNGALASAAQKSDSQLPEAEFGPAARLASARVSQALCTVPPRRCSSWAACRLASHRCCWTGSSSTAYSSSCLSAR